MKKNKFTLIEMVIVCAILLFLAAGLFALGNVLFKKYFIMQGKMEMIKIQNALATYKSATGEYPPDYRSSSYNEDATGNSIGKWLKPIYLNLQWEGFKQAKDFYDKYFPPLGCPKALVHYKDGSGNSKWGVWTWSWFDDIGGELPNEVQPGIAGGYICQQKIQANIGDFGTRFPSGSVIDPATGVEKDVLVNFVNIVESSVLNVLKCDCGPAGIYDCEKSDPSSSNYQCGWHNFSLEVWEGCYNSAEMSKALYDYLCRPMKGRMKEGVPVAIKYLDAKPFIEVSNKLIRPAGRPPRFDCNGKAMLDTPLNYKKYGDGLYNMTDSFELIDVWGSSYFYVSSAKEYTTPSYTYTYKPYQVFWLSGSTLGASESFALDLYPPFYNPLTYDLGSRGPDKRSANWIPNDFKLAAPSGYEGRTGGENKKFLFGQVDESGVNQNFLVLPSESLKLLDYDNDNLNNFSENDN